MKIHVTKWASKTIRGPGPASTIMARPRTWERGDGTVPVLVPSHVMLTAVRRNEIGVGVYRADYVAHLEAHGLAPGRLLARLSAGALARVADGATVCCACSRAAAERGECHRVWAAELLRRAGWVVVLDGRELAGVTADWRPVWEVTGGASKE